MTIQQDLDAALAGEDQAVSDLLATQATLISEMTNAFNRLLAKVASGNVDLTSEISSINSNTQKLTDANTAATSAIASAKVEGN